MIFRRLVEEPKKILKWTENDHLSLRETPRSVLKRIEKCATSIVTAQNKSLVHLKNKIGGCFSFDVTLVLQTKTLYRNRITHG